MRIQRIENNQPAFGIKYVNKKAWNQKVLNILKESKIAQEIDNKYPKAKATYDINQVNDLKTGDKLYSISFNLNLTKDKTWTYQESNYFKDIPARHLAAIIQGLTLSGLEKSIDNPQITKKILADNASFNIVIGELNPIKRFFKNLFG